MITTLLLIACFVGLLAAKPWVFVLGALALLLMHPLVLLLALVVVGGGLIVVVNAWRRHRYAPRLLRGRHDEPRNVREAARGDMPWHRDE